jgi:hypothetical protein
MTPTECDNELCPERCVDAESPLHNKISHLAAPAYVNHDGGNFQCELLPCSVPLSARREVFHRKKVSEIKTTTRWKLIDYTVTTLFTTR